MKLPAQSVRDRMSTTVALDRRAQAIAAERGISLVEAYSAAIDEPGSVMIANHLRRSLTDGLTEFERRYGEGGTNPPRIGRE